MNYETYSRETGEKPDTQKLQMQSRNLDYEQVGISLVHQLGDYCNQAGQNGYVIGVSGGIDSAVVSTLAAMTGLPTVVVEMPIHQRSEEVGRAQHHTEWLQEKFPNVTRRTHDLTHIFDVFSREIEAIGHEKDTYLALVNTRSRIRMVFLYAIGNTEGLLVAGTGNQVEDYGIGFFTKYGDGGVDVSPIGNLYKSEVRELGRRLGISSLLTEAVATDGLHTTGATDEDQIGATYEELEWAMEQYDLGRTDNFTERAGQVMQIYTERHLKNAHKIAPIPVFNFPLGNTTL